MVRSVDGLIRRGGDAARLIDGGEDETISLPLVGLRSGVGVVC